MNILPAGPADSIVTDWAGCVVRHANGAVSEYLAGWESRRLAPKFGLQGKRIILWLDEPGQATTVTILPRRTGWLGWMPGFDAARLVLCDATGKTTHVSVPDSRGARGHPVLVVAA